MDIRKYLNEANTESRSMDQRFKLIKMYVRNAEQAYKNDNDIKVIQKALKLVVDQIKMVK